MWEKRKVFLTSCPPLYSDAQHPHELVQRCALPVLPEDPGSMPSTCIAAHNSSMAVTPSHIYTCRQNTSEREVEINYTKKFKVIKNKVYNYTHIY